MSIYIDAAWCIFHSLMSYFHKTIMHCNIIKSPFTYECHILHDKIQYASVQVCLLVNMSCVDMT